MANDEDTSTLESLADETGATPKDMIELATSADIVFLSIPMKEIPNLLKGLFENCSDRCIVVDTCNYYPSRDGKIKEIENGMPESMWVMQQIGRPVVKALNTILAPALLETGRPKGAPGRIAVPISGNDHITKNIISKLIDDLGFDVYDAGDLALSWRQQPGSPVYCTNLDLQHLAFTLGAANKDVLPKRRDEAYRKMTSSDRQMNWKEMVDMLRSTYGTAREHMSSSELNGRPAAHTQESFQA
jgi:predicted dinucleotide-binding enzyme